MSERQIKEEKNAILTRERLRIICCSPEQINAKKKKRKKKGVAEAALVHPAPLLLVFVRVEAKLCRSFCRLSGTNRLLEAEDGAAD